MKRSEAISSGHSGRDYVQPFNRLSLMICRCAGVDVEILKLAEYDEAGKYVAQGVFVLVTGAMAFLTGSYTLYLIFDSYGASIIFGVVWAVVIFTFDRMVLLSLRKEGTRSRQLLTALPRLLVAIVLALILSTPIELKVFEKDILLHISKDREEIWKRNINRRKKAKEEVIDNQKRHLNTQKGYLQTEIEQLNNEFQQVAKSEIDLHKIGVRNQDRWNRSILAQSAKGFVTERNKYSSEIEKKRNSITDINQQIKNLDDELFRINNAEERFEDNRQATFREKLVALVKLQVPGLADDSSRPAPSRNQPPDPAAMQVNGPQTGTGDSSTTTNTNQNQGGQSRAVAPTQNRNDQPSLSSPATEPAQDQGMRAAEPESGSDALLESATTVAAGWAIRLLLFLLEVSPVMLKLSSKPGRYDEFLSAARETGRSEVVRNFGVVKLFNESLRQRIGRMIDKDMASPEAVIQLMSQMLGYRAGKIEPLYSEAMLKQVGRFLNQIKMKADHQAEHSRIRQALADLEYIMQNPTRHDEVFRGLNDLVQQVQSLLIPSLHSKQEITEFLAALKQILSKMEKQLEVNNA